MNKIIVSMTTVPSRINTLSHVLDSIFNQTVQPDLVSIYVSKEEFLENSLHYDYDRVKITYVDGNIRGHKKYFYAFKEFKDDIVITIDDDVVYDRNTIEKLLLYHKKYPNTVIANRGRFIGIANGEVARYHNWVRNYPVDHSSMLLMGTGVLGILYCPNWFDDSIFDLSCIINKNVIWCDDVWLKFQELKSGISVVLTDLNKEINLIEGSQEQAICKMNHKHGFVGKSVKFLSEKFRVDFLDLLKRELRNSKKEVLYNGHYSVVSKVGPYILKEIKNENARINEEVYNTIKICEHTDLRTHKVLAYDETNKKILYDYIEMNDFKTEVLSKRDYDQIISMIKNFRILDVTCEAYNRYFDNCKIALNYYEQLFGMSEFRKHLLNSEYNCFVHGDIGKTNIKIVDNEIIFLDYENSGKGPDWWDKSYLLADYALKEIDNSIIAELNKTDMERIALIKQIRIGRLIRKGMDYMEKMSDLNDFISLYNEYLKGNDK